MAWPHTAFTNSNRFRMICKPAVCGKHARKTHLRCYFRRVGRRLRIKSCMQNTLAVGRVKTMADACMSSSTHGCHICSDDFSKRFYYCIGVLSSRPTHARSTQPRPSQTERNKRTHPKWQRRARSGHGHGAPGVQMPMTHTRTPTLGQAAQRGTRRGERGCLGQILRFLRFTAASFFFFFSLPVCCFW
jgi:hypothetical protein